MNDIALAIEEARTEIAEAANEILPDLCDIDGPTFVEGGSSGDHVTIGPVATNINVSYRGLSGGRQIVVGGEGYTASHELPGAERISAWRPSHLDERQSRRQRQWSGLLDQIVDADAKQPHRPAAGVGSGEQLERAGEDLVMIS